MKHNGQVKKHKRIPSSVRMMRWFGYMLATAVAMLSVCRGPRPAWALPGVCQAPARYDLKASHGVLQANLARELRLAGLQGQIERGKLGVAMADLSEGGRIYYAGVNDNQMMYAASLPKIAILLAVFRDVVEGRLPWTHELERRLVAMVTVSSNSDASWAADLVGLEGIASAVEHPAWCFYDRRHGGLWMGRAYRKGARARRDPLKNLSHAATARQTARFYVMLASGALLSRYWSQKMQEVMGPPGHTHKFVAGLADTPEAVFVARKSGTWKNAHSDSALIEHHGKRYVVAGVAEFYGGEMAMRKLAKIADRLVMEGEHRTLP